MIPTAIKNDRWYLFLFCAPPPANPARIPAACGVGRVDVTGGWYDTVSLPRTPFPGLIVGYAFLWSDEARQGRTQARKDRPCVIVLAVRRQTDHRIRVRVVPITHMSHDPERAVALPPKVKRHLGLDADASWIVLDQANEFVWPGVDLRPISRTKPGVWSYGVLPAELFDELRQRLRSILNERRTHRSD